MTPFMAVFTAPTGSEVAYGRDIGMSNPNARYIQEVCAGCGERKWTRLDYAVQRDTPCMCPVCHRHKTKNMGENNGHWRGDQVKVHAGNRRALNRFPDNEPCVVCGCTIERIHRHHADGNTLNNTRANIVFLCPLHHRQAHRDNLRMRNGWRREGTKWFKPCTKCHRLLDWTSNYYTRANGDRDPMCKECHRESARITWRQKYA